MCDGENSFDLEVEALQSIYIHELELLKAKSEEHIAALKVNLRPATGENEQEQFVCLDLWLHIPKGYPECVPEVEIRNSRGLSDDKLEEIQKEVVSTANDNISMPMLYQLIEVAKEHLTRDNIPHCACAICLYPFTHDDIFIKTECFHHFHSHCLWRYVQHGSQSECDSSSSAVVCPVCREPIAVDVVSLSPDVPPPTLSLHVDSEQDNAIAEWREIQRKMENLFIKQQQNGGIINVEDEKNKYLLEISSLEDETLLRNNENRIALEMSKRIAESPKERLSSSQHKPIAPPSAKCSQSASNNGQQQQYREELTTAHARHNNHRRGPKHRPWPTAAEKRRMHNAMVEPSSPIEDDSNVSRSGGHDYNGSRKQEMSAGSSHLNRKSNFRHDRANRAGDRTDDTVKPPPGFEPRHYASDSSRNVRHQSALESESLNCEGQKTVVGGSSGKGSSRRR